MLMGSENSGNELLRKLADVAKRLGEGGNPDDHDTRTLLADAKFQLSSGPSACELLETIGIDLPSIFMKIAVTTTGACKELAESLLEILLKSCDARDMFTAYMEVLDLYTVPDSPEICFLLLDGLSKIFVRIQRRRTAYIKDSVLGILKAVRAVADTDYSWKVVDKAIQLAIVLVDLTLHEKVNEQIQKLHEILAIFILLLLEQVSEIKQVNYSITVQPMIMQLARQLSVCGLTDLDLITGRFCEKVIDALTDDLVDGDGYIVQVKQGAMVAGQIESHGGFSV